MATLVYICMYADCGNDCLSMMLYIAFRTLCCLKVHYVYSVCLVYVYKRVHVYIVSEIIIVCIRINFYYTVCII